MQRRKATRAKRHEDVLRHLFDFGNHNDPSLGSLIKSACEFHGVPSSAKRTGEG